MKYEAIIFDLDGTILNTLPDLTESVNFALKKYNFPTRTIDEVRSFVGNGVGLLIKRSLPTGTDDKICEDCLTEFKIYYENHYAVKTVPYDGICDVLSKIKDKGIKIGVVSNKFDSAVRELCKIYFDGLIDVSVGEKEGVPRKPSPDSAEYVIRILDVPKNKILYVGDSEVDILTAKNAGLQSISVSWGFKSKEFLFENGASKIIDNPNQILNILE